MKQREYDFFMNQKLRPRCIMGTDYYVTNEHLHEAGRDDDPERGIFWVLRDCEAVL